MNAGTQDSELPQEVPKESQADSTLDTNPSFTQPKRKDGQFNAEVQQLEFHGFAGTLFGIWIVNVFFTLLTLGLYYFWAKVKVRRYILSQTSFAGDRFNYHGTGTELLIGWIKAVVFFGVPFLILRYGPVLIGAGKVVMWMSWILATALLLAFPAFVKVWALRYRLSRTSWRSIRFSFKGRASVYLKLFTRGSLLTALTCGLYYPFYATQKRAFMVSESSFGSERFSFNGEGKELFGVYLEAFKLSASLLGIGALTTYSLFGVTPNRMASLLVIVFVSLFLFGFLPWFFILAQVQRFFWDHTALGGCRFRCTVTAEKLLWLRSTSVWPDM